MQPNRIAAKPCTDDRHDPKDGPVLVTIHYFKPTSGKWYCDDENVVWAPDPSHYTGWQDFRALHRLRNMTAVCIVTPLGFPQSSPGDLSKGQVGDEGHLAPVTCTKCRQNPCFCRGASGGLAGPVEPGAYARNPTVRCWRCKQDVSEGATVTLAGIGTQCQDTQACLVRRRGGPAHRPSDALTSQTLCQTICCIRKAKPGSVWCAECAEGTENHRPPTPEEASLEHTCHAGKFALVLDFNCEACTTALHTGGFDSWLHERLEWVRRSERFAGRKTAPKAWLVSTWLETKAELERCLILFERIADLSHGEECSAWDCDTLDCECPVNEETEETEHIQFSCTCGVWDAKTRAKSIRAVLERTLPTEENVSQRGPEAQALPPGTIETMLRRLGGTATFTRDELRRGAQQHLVRTDDDHTLKLTVRWDT